jgi:hypothetical protein
MREDLTLDVKKMQTLLNCRAITPGAAQLLVKSKPPGGIHLPGLKTLPPAVAAIFARSKMPFYLNGLETLTPEAAHALSRSVATFTLDGLRTISPKTLAALRSTSRPIGLNGIRSLSDAAVKILVRFAAQRVRLADLSQVSPASHIRLINSTNLYVPKLRGPREILKLLSRLLPGKDAIEFKFWAEKAEWLGLFLKESHLWGERMSKAEKRATLAVDNFNWDMLWDEMHFRPDYWGIYQSTATVHMQLKPLRAPMKVLGQKLPAGFRGLVIRGKIIDATNEAAVAVNFCRSFRCDLDDTSVRPRSPVAISDRPTITRPGHLVG